MFGITLSLLDNLLIHGFSIGEKNFKKLFQFGFNNGGCFLVSLKIFFVMNSANPLTTSKPIMKTFSLQETIIHFHYVLNLESL